MENISIFEYNFNFIKQERLILNKEIIEYVHHPIRVKEWMFNQ